jgi:hypothetical protein
VHELGLEVAVVVGGGNYFRGRMAESLGIGRTEADDIGMPGTVMNALMLRGALTARTDADVRVMTAFPLQSMAEPYIRLRAVRHLRHGAIVVLAGGSANRSSRPTTQPSSGLWSWARTPSSPPSTVLTASTTATRTRDQGRPAWRFSPTKRRWRAKSRSWTPVRWYRRRARPRDARVRRSSERNHASHEAALSSWADEIAMAAPR